MSQRSAKRLVGGSNGYLVIRPDVDVGDIEMELDENAGLVFPEDADGGG